nr:post-transcriptional regulator [uncultured Bacillus sp.]
MVGSHEYDRFRNEVRPALKSKQEEFSLLGYNNVSEGEIWEYLKRKKWRKVAEPLKLHEMVQQILSLKAGEYMHYISIKALKEADFSLEDEGELMELLK